LFNKKVEKMETKENFRKYLDEYMVDFFPEIKENMGIEYEDFLRAKTEMAFRLYNDMIERGEMPLMAELGAIEVLKEGYTNSKYSYIEERIREMDEDYYERLESEGTLKKKIIEIVKAGEGIFEKYGFEKIDFAYTDEFEDEMMEVIKLKL